MTAEKWSAVLEIVSFFLVTIDLFGSERLEKLQARIKAFDKKSFSSGSYGLMNFLVKRTKDAQKDKIVKSLVIALFWLAAWIGWAYFFTCFLLPNSMGDIFRNETLDVIFLITLSGLLGYLSWALFVASLIVLAITLEILIGAAIKMITRFKLEGFMLITGAFFFLISKAIILYN